MKQEHDTIDLVKLYSIMNKLEKLKCITRHSWMSSARQESVAEHSWRLAALLLLLRDNLDGYDIEKMMKMALFHDLGEIKFGDVPGFLKTHKDVEHESQALDDFEMEYQDPIISDIVNTVREFDSKESKEARFLNALDKIEGLIQHNEADLATWIDREYDLNLTYGMEECTCDPLLIELRLHVKAEAVKKINADRFRPEE